MVQHNGLHGSGKTSPALARVYTGNFWLGVQSVNQRSGNEFPELIAIPRDPCGRNPPCDPTLTLVSHESVIMSTEPLAVLTVTPISGRPIGNLCATRADFRCE